MLQRFLSKVTASLMAYCMGNFHDALDMERRARSWRQHAEVALRELLGLVVGASNQLQFCHKINRPTNEFRLQLLHKVTVGVERL